MKDKGERNYRGLVDQLVYFGSGIIGTASVNVICIISMSLFALMITTDIKQWEAFHSLAGEIMFLPWLGVYLISAIKLEKVRLNIQKDFNPNQSLGNKEGGIMKL